jgi:coenzyme F420 hydrogenase subunit beta
MPGTIELEKSVINTGLCTNCGACINLCPYLISFKGRVIRVFNCEIDNGRCHTYCPRTNVDLESLRDEFFNKETYVHEIGPFLGLYMTRATDTALRSNSQHGGTTTTLVELALKEGFIDAAVLTQSSGGLDPRPLIVSRPEDVRSCQGSSFQINPTLAGLNEALKEKAYRNIGVVGTPCKTLAAYKIKRKLSVDTDNGRDNIGMVFGLFCGWGLDWQGLDNLVKRHTPVANLNLMDILPSSFAVMELQTADGPIKITLDEVYPIIKECCNYCIDFTAEFSDISIGGARSSAGWEVDKGWNQLIVRTEKGKELVQLAREKGVLVFREVETYNLDKLKKASMNKKRTGIKNLLEKTGSKSDLMYLNPSDPLIKKILDSSI